MADIILILPDVPGESTKVGYVDKIQCELLRETLEVPRAGTNRRARHSDIELTRPRDRATPLLAHACSSGKNFATGTIHILGQAGTPVVTYELTSVIVSKIEYETLDGNGTAYLPHSPAGTEAVYNAVSPNPVAGAGALAAQVLEGGQLIPRPYLTRGFSAPSTKEIERIWLNAVTVEWKHTGTGGVTSRGWNIFAGARHPAVSA